MVAGLVFILASLACNSDDAILVERLPTLTPTPLPTLTPTPNATPVAMTLAAEPPAADNSQNPAPSGVAPAESEVMVAGIAPFAEPIIPDAGPTGPEASTDSPPAESVDSAGNSPNVPAPAEDASAANPPTPTATATATEITPTPTETVIPTETPTPAPTPTATPPPQGWVFSDVQIYPVGEVSGIMFYGNVMNDTGGPLQLNEINTTLYDAQGQKIPYQEAFNQLPFQVVAQGEQVPFQVVIPNVQDAVADFNFEVP